LFNVALTKLFYSIIETNRMKKIYGLCLVLSMVFSCKSIKSSSISSSDLFSYDVEQRIIDMNIQLKSPGPITGANIVRAVRSGDLIFLSGKGPTKPNGNNITGKIGIDLSTEEGYQAAKVVAINQLAILKDEIGDLNKVVQVVKVFGMVNASADFTKHSQVINGFSDLIVDVFGDRGKHARAAVGMSSLPGNIAVEIDMVVQIRD